VILLMLSFSSFPSFPKFHRVAPLLKTCSTSMFVYDHAYFLVYVYLWIYLLCMRENMCLLCFWSWLTSLNMMSSNYIHLPSNPMSFTFKPCHYSLWLSNTPFCIYTTISWSIHQL
jgi:hypothetical protein